MSHPRRRIPIKSSSSTKKPVEGESRLREPSEPRSLPSSHLNPNPRHTQSKPIDGDEDEDDEDDNLYRSSSSLGPSEPPAPQFQPFFTLMSDPSTSEHHHPTVHYIFVDDDPDIITEAACRSLAISAPSVAVDVLAEAHEGHQTQAGEDSGDEDEGADRGHEIVSNKLPPSQPGVREHYILLDVHPQVQPSSASAAEAPKSVTTANPTITPSPDPVFEIVSANSLSPHWALLNTSITTAPTMGGETSHIDDAQGQGQGLMLKIEGVGASDPTLEAAGAAATSKSLGLGLGGGKGKGKARAETQSVQEMMEGFEKGLETVRKVMEGMK